MYWPFLGAAGWLGRLVLALGCLIATPAWTWAGDAVTPQSTGSIQTASETKNESAQGNLIGHGGPVKSIAIDTERRLGLTGSFDYAMMAWDLTGDLPKETQRFDENDGGGQRGGVCTAEPPSPFCWRRRRACRCGISTMRGWSTASKDTLPRSLISPFRMTAPGRSPRGLGSFGTAVEFARSQTWACSCRSQGGRLTPLRFQLMEHMRSRQAMMVPYGCSRRTPETSSGQCFDMAGASTHSSDCPMMRGWCSVH